MRQPLRKAAEAVSNEGGVTVLAFGPTGGSRERQRDRQRDKDGQSERQREETERERERHTER